MNTIWNVVNLRLKLIYRNLAIQLLTLVTVVLFSLLIGSLYAEIEESTKIKIGVVDESKTDFSIELVNNLHKNNFFETEETTIKKGIPMVNKGEITALFVIKEDVEDRVYEGDFDELIDLYFLSDNYLSPMVGDVFVGEMLEEISIITAVSYLEEALGEDRVNPAILQAAYQYGQELSKSRKEDYYVVIDVISLEDNENIASDKLNHQVLYKQMILGIILSFLSFFTLFTATSIVKDVETALVKKLVISKTAKWKIVVGEYFSIVISSSIIALILSSVSAAFGNHFMPDFLLFVLVFVLFISTISALILFMTKQITKVSSFIVLGAVIILIMGIISGCFFNIDLTVPVIKNISFFTPTYQALNRLMEIVVNEKIVNMMGYILYTVVSTTLLLVASIFLWRVKEK